MPLRRCRDTTKSTFENCDGLLDNRKKTLWRLEGPCAALSASLEATGGPGEYELGHVLGLLEGLLRRGDGLHNVGFFTWELRDNGALSIWLDAVCKEAGRDLELCRERIEVAKTLHAAACRLRDEGVFAEPEYAVSEEDFIAVEEVWRLAASKESNASEAMATLKLSLADAVRERAKAVTMHVVFGRDGVTGAAGWIELEMICGSRLDADTASGAALFVLDRAAVALFRGHWKGRPRHPPTSPSQRLWKSSSESSQTVGGG